MTRYADPAGVDRAREMIAQLLAGADAGRNQIAHNTDEIARLEREVSDLQTHVAANFAAADMIESAMVAAGFFPARASSVRVVPLPARRA